MQGPFVYWWQGNPHFSRKERREKWGTRKIPTLSQKAREGWGNPALNGIAFRHG